MPLITSFSELPPGNAASSESPAEGLFASREWYENYVATVVGDPGSVALVEMIGLPKFSTSAWQMLLAGTRMPAVLRLVSMILGTSFVPVKIKV